MMDFGVVLAAAGAGRRFGSRKQLLELLGRPLLHYSLDVFASVDDASHVALVMAPEDLDTGRAIVAAWRASGAGRRRGGLPIEIVPGGARRQDSVARGLEALPHGLRFALVHDAARPLVEAASVRALVAATRSHGAAVIGTPVVDSVKRVAGGAIVAELSRDELWTVQTPQAGEIGALRRAYAAAGAVEMTDESSALRAAGVSVALVAGARDNVKITRPEDVPLAEAILRARAPAVAGATPEGP